MIFLSQNGQDEYINMFAQGCGISSTNTLNFDFDASTDPIVLRGILKHKIMKQCWAANRDFYYMDSGYFGNQPCASNPNGWKLWHRIVRNNLQLNHMLDCPSDRWLKHKIHIRTWRRTGSRILIAAPDEKPCKFYGIDQQQWIDDTVAKIKQHSDREIVIRKRNPSRQHRVHVDTLEQALNNDVFALVTFNSNAAVESIMQGIPTFVLAPCHAAGPVSEKDISKIESPYYADTDKLQAWASSLAYGQFHVDELKNGSAKHMMEQYQ